MKKKVIIFLIIILGIFLASWVIKPENLREIKEKVRNIFFENQTTSSYNAKSLILVDLSNDEIFISKNADEKQVPASLAKLFVIEYATTFTNLNDIVTAKSDAIALTKEGSSVANIKAKKYYLKDLFAAMLVPSGNDAAYVVADYCGGILSPTSSSSKERINIFMENLNIYI